eukprot:gb/GECG01016398.1/.p1 GENE.gb/GECG01016398.1/~~gb/GECG01016398.1/.p1  ORF type:complete len:271 (+),score=31.14 gb/GECG01016398.1/:1-813(+)
MATETTLLSIPGLSASKASAITDGAPSFTPRIKKQLQRSLETLFASENEKEMVTSFFEKNKCRFKITEKCICWSSPKMQQNVAEYCDPFHFDGTHNIPVLGRKQGSDEPLGNLYQFVTPSREGGIAVIAQALTYGEASDVATSILEFVDSLFDANPPQVIFTDDSSGFRKAVRNVWKKSIHKGCGFHIFKRWRQKLQKFKNKTDMKRAKVLLWRSITIIDSCSNDAAWEELQRLCEKNLPSTTLKPFLKYYRQNRKYWSLKDSPRRVFLG